MFRLEWELQRGPVVSMGQARMLSPSESQNGQGTRLCVSQTPQGSFQLAQAAFHLAVIGVAQQVCGPLRQSGHLVKEGAFLTLAGSPTSKPVMHSPWH